MPNCGAACYGSIHGGALKERLMFLLCTEEKIFRTERKPP